MKFDHAALLDLVRWIAELDARAWLTEHEQRRKHPDGTRPDEPKDAGDTHGA